jgi:predicted acetyltransferase
MARIHHASFPGVSMTLEERISYFRNNPRLKLQDHWVCERKGRLVGMFALYNFKMHRGPAKIPLGGIGMVAVAPEARRQRIAYWMMLRAVQIMEQNGLPLSALYPFSHGFYRKLGWGVVGKTSLYRFPSGSLPAYPERTGMAPVLTYEDQSAVMSCYDKFASVSNGLLERDEPVWFERIFKSMLCYAWKNSAGQVDGYLVFNYVPLSVEESLTGVDVNVRDIVWNNDEALRGLIGFLAAQSDQARAVILPDQAGLGLEHCLADPLMAGGRNNWSMGAETAWVGSGLMGRIISLRRVLAATKFPGVKGNVTFELKDELNPANAEPLCVEFDGGSATFPKGGEDGVVLRTEMAVFSSLFWGALRLPEARRLGLVEIEGGNDAAFLNRLFSAPKPICYDYF